MTESMNSEVQSTGYWVASPSETLTNFAPGIYTVVGGDEWGTLVVANFMVSATSFTTTTSVLVTSAIVTQNQQPVEIISVVGPLQPFNPGGPLPLIRSTVTPEMRKNAVNLKSPLQTSRGFLSSIML
jgi:hypothetical protein